MINYLVEKEYQGLVDAYEKIGGDKSTLLNNDIASLIVHENKVLSANAIEGVKLTGESQEHGIMAGLLIEEGCKVSRPVHLCFGILPQEGLQEIGLRVDVRKGAEVKVIAHCIFPNAVHIIHKMDAVINIEDNASFSYKETHYHGESGGIEVIPRARVTLGEKAVYENTFSLVEGCVGKLDFDFEVSSAARSIADMILKVYGKKDDVIKIAERVNLNGNSARSMIKTRVVLRDRARAEIIGETYGNAPYARGHVDCVELINGEEAVGSIDRRQVETLMARGLDENEAVDVIVRGILR